MRKNAFEDLDKYHPEITGLSEASEYDVYVLTNNITAGKFVKSDKLTNDEMKMLAEKLNDEWVKTVIEPYVESFHAFCEKYEIAVLESECSIGVAPMDKFVMSKMMGDSLSRLLGRD